MGHYQLAVIGMEGYQQKVINRNVVNNGVINGRCSPETLKVTTQNIQMRVLKKKGKVC